MMNGTGFPAFKGEAASTSIKCCVSSNRDTKLSTAYTAVTLEGAQRQVVRLAWNDLLAIAHSWPGSLENQPFQGGMARLPPGLLS